MKLLDMIKHKRQLKRIEKIIIENLKMDTSIMVNSIYPKINKAIERAVLCGYRGITIYFAEKELPKVPESQLRIITDATKFEILDRNNDDDIFKRVSYLFSIIKSNTTELGDLARIMARDYNNKHYLAEEYYHILTKDDDRPWDLSVNIIWDNGYILEARGK